MPAPQQEGELEGGQMTLGLRGRYGGLCGQGFGLYSKSCRKPVKVLRRGIASACFSYWFFSCVIHWYSSVSKIQKAILWKNTFPPLPAFTATSPQVTTIVVFGISSQNFSFFVYISKFLKYFIFFLTHTSPNSIPHNCFVAVTILLSTVS